MGRGLCALPTFVKEVWPPNISIGWFAKICCSTFLTIRHLGVGFSLQFTLQKVVFFSLKVSKAFILMKSHDTAKTS